MKAVQHNRHGGPDVLELVELADPEPGPVEVVVAVVACGVNRLDILQREGPALLPEFQLPHVAGMDVAGEVAAVGSDVDGIAPGARVLVKAGIRCGRCPSCLSGDDRYCTSTRTIGGDLPGGYAELCVVPSTNVVAIPEAVSLVEAATVPTACSIAWRSLVDTARLERGETVVIHGAGGGVSVIGVQIAKRLGATVIVTSRSQDKLARALEIGADVVVNEGTEDVVGRVREATGGLGADAVFNHVGSALFDLSLRLLRPGGRLVVCGTTTGAEVALRLPALYHHGLQILGTTPGSDADFRSMLGLYWQCGYRAVIDSCLSLADVARAQQRLESGEAFGKIVVCP